MRYNFRHLPSRSSVGLLVTLVLGMLIGTTGVSFVYRVPEAVAQTTPDREAVLQGELDSLQQEMEGLNGTIKNLQGEKQGLDRDIKLLNAQVARSNLNIRQKNLQLQRLGTDITDKKTRVNVLSAKLERERKSLSQLVRKTNELDQTSMVEVILAQENISDYFLDADSFLAIRAGIKTSMDQLRGVKQATETEQNALEDKQRKEADARAEMEKAKRAVERTEGEKKTLLSITKNKEKTYQGVLADKKKRAAQIRAALFALRDSGEIPFGKALDYATLASSKTGVRPAFILAIFSQESSFGKNQGSCLLKDKVTGSGVGVRSGSVILKVMKPDRDVEPFLVIANETGRDPFNTRVSCPQEIGWGGAMGPAQFIPSTWMMLRNRVAGNLGIATVDPWTPRDAFMAAGVYLGDIGASGGTRSAERDAACRYFSGSKCSKSTWAAGYGDSVIAKADNIQENMIDPLNNL